MSYKSNFRTGPLSYTEWDGFWKATPEATLMTGEEWDEAWDSLKEWLSKRYLLDYTIGIQRHCYIEGDWAQPERTMTIIILVAEVLTVGFLHYIQTWLNAKAPKWRVFIPTDNTDENLIIIYSEAIKINPAAEVNLPGFIKAIRPKLAQVIIEGHKEFNLPFKPHPPLPEEE